MLAVDTALRGSVAKVGGLLVYSGALICESQWRAAAKNFPLSVPLVQTHGRQDQVLPIATGRWLSELLQDIGCQGNLFEFNGPHTIPTEALVSTAKLLTNVGGRSQ
jgi:phospholipase/carboxylesterase